MLLIRTAWGDADGHVPAVCSLFQQTDLTRGHLAEVIRLEASVHRAIKVMEVSQQQLTPTRVIYFDP